MPEPFFTEKELFNMMQDLGRTITALQVEMTKTQTLIREYNGLRAMVSEVNVRVTSVEDKLDGHCRDYDVRRKMSRDMTIAMVGWAIAVASLVWGIISWAGR